MPNDMIHVDPYERLKFGDKFISFEEEMKATVKSIKNRLAEASGHLQDPGSKHCIDEGTNLVDELLALLDGGISETGAGHKAKALQQIQLMEEFGSQMKR